MKMGSRAWCKVVVGAEHSFVQRALAAFFDGSTEVDSIAYKDVHVVQVSSSDELCGVGVIVYRADWDDMCTPLDFNELGAEILKAKLILEPIFQQRGMDLSVFTICGFD
jgi:hypothetical protein